MKKFFLIIILLISSLAYSQDQTGVVKGRVQSETSESILQNVHVLNLTKVKGTITNSSGEFEIKAKVNDTLYFSYIGYKPLKIVVTNDLVRFEDNTIELTELAFALEEGHSENPTAKKMVLIIVLGFNLGRLLYLIPFLKE